jgi:prepilin-type N-terminal cleavage/methylation domain-containing protein
MTSPATRHSLRATSPSTPHAPCSMPRKSSGFTLIELLVVIAILAILAGIAFPAMQGAIKSARKAEARSMANQIKLAISSYYAEYGTYPAVTEANANFVNAMSGATNVSSIPNRRGIRFLEVPPKFSGSAGIVTPEGLYKDRSDRRVFRIKTDANYDGQLNLGFTNMAGSVAVWADDPDGTGKYLGTW